MHFGDLLRSHTEGSAWKEHFIDYEGLKRLLHELFPAAQRVGDEDDSSWWEWRRRRASSAVGVDPPAQRHRLSNAFERHVSELTQLSSPDSQLAYVALAGGDEDDAGSALAAVDDDADDALEEAACAGAPLCDLEDGVKVALFFKRMTAELAKVEAFHADMQRRVASTFASVKVQAENMATPAEVKNTQRALIESFRTLSQLQNFRELNRLGFLKASKKMEKKRGRSSRGSDVFLARVARSPFIQDKLVDSMAAEAVDMYAEAFEHGDRHRARAKLLARLSKTGFSKLDILIFGFKLGAIVVLMAWNATTLARRSPQLNAYSGFVPVYRGIFLLLCELWFWGASVGTWTHFRINYAFIFELKVFSRLPHLQLFSEAANLTIALLINLLLFVYEIGEVLGISSLVFPFGLFVFVCLKLVFPLFSHWDTRRQLLSSLWHVLIAPFGRVRFQDFFIADVVTSMVKIVVDLFYDSCYFLTGIWIHETGRDNSCHDTKWLAVPLFSALPMWFRFAQCVRRYYNNGDRSNLLNALKYALACVTVVLGSFHPVYTVRGSSWTGLHVTWLLLIVASTLYSFAWDVLHDWRLFQTPDGLREQLLYSNRAFYYWAIASNFVLRFAWSLTILPFTFARFLSANGYGNDTVFKPLLYLAELARRFQWSLLRVESEQLTNPERYRPTSYVPLLFETEETQKRNAEATRTQQGVVVEVTLMLVAVIVFSVIAAVA